MRYSERMIRILAIVVVLLICMFLIQRYAMNPGKSWAEEPPVTFDIKPVPGEGPVSRWLASYSSQGKTAVFRIEVGPARNVEAKSAEGDMRLPFRVGEGSFSAVGGSEASVLLLDLKRALQANALPSPIQRTQSVPFKYVILGEHLKGDATGHSESATGGDWTSMKLFFTGRKGEPEVFLNLSSAMGKGQFSIKDPEYGDKVLSELAKVL